MAQWRHVGFGPARAVAAVANVLAARLGWIARPAVRSLQSGPANMPAWTTRTTVWRQAPARLSLTPAHIIRAVTS